MARSRKGFTFVPETPDTNVQQQGENTMSAFEVVSREEWVEQGAGNSARKGEYTSILGEMADSGQRYFRINTAKDSGGRFAGKKASAVATALKQARDAKNAPENLSNIQITSKSEKGAEGIGLVFVENTGVEA